MARVSWMKRKARDWLPALFAFWMVCGMLASAYLILVGDGAARGWGVVGMLCVCGVFDRCVQRSS